MCSSEGLFISVDGPSGVGKSGTVQALSQVLADEGRVVHITCEPSDGPIGKLARELTDTVHGSALACLYAADRYHHLVSEIRPHLDSGEVVITDRYIPSALVMQKRRSSLHRPQLGNTGYASLPRRRRMQYGQYRSKSLHCQTPRVHLLWK